MNTPAKHRNAEDTYLRIKTLVESRGWQEFLLPYIEKQMESNRDAALLDPKITIDQIHEQRGGYQALHKLLEHLKAHQRLAASVIAKEELKVHSPSR